MYKIGMSTDIHQLVEKRDLILGGVKIQHELGLLGHSDADVVIHAIGEAIIGALGFGDLGRHFPDTDPKYEGVDSRYLLSCIYQMMDEAGYTIANIDSIILAEKPKLAPFIEQMVANVAACLKTPISSVNIKATRGEKLGFIGRQEGIVCQAVVLIKRK